MSTVAVTIAVPLSDVRRFLVILASEGTGGGACRAFVPKSESESESESDELEDDELDDDDSEEDESFALDFLDFTAVALVDSEADFFAAEVESFLAMTLIFTGSSSELLSSLEESLPDDSVLLVSRFAVSFDSLSFTSGSELDEESSSESSELELEDGEGALDLGGAGLEDLAPDTGLATEVSESDSEDSESEEDNDDDDDDDEGASFFFLMSFTGSGALGFEVEILGASFFLVVALELESAEESESESEESEESESDSASEDESGSELESESEESPLIAFLYRSTITSRLGPATVTSSLRTTTSFTEFFKTEAALVCLFLTKKA